MSLSRCLISSAVLAGTVFCSTTLPLAAFSSKPVTIQLEEKPVFVGQVEEFAVPYIGLAAAISFAVGATSLATAGWRQSARKLEQTETQLSALKQQLSEKSALLEDITFSQQRLSTSGLEFFLHEDGAPLPPATTSVATPVQDDSSASPYVVVGTQSSESAAAHPAAAHATTAQAATALASAQAFMGFARPAQAETVAIAPPENAAQLDELMAHLKQVMTQIERMQIGSDAPVHAGSPAWQQQRLAS